MVEDPRRNLRRHPAVKAWCQLRPECLGPDKLEIMQWSVSGDIAVYWMGGVGPAGSAVIAKRCQRARALFEHAIYAEILPKAPFTSLRSYGYLEEPEGEFCWLFLEDAGSERYAPDIEEHRALAARWLGLLHTYAAQNCMPTQFPDRGPNWYLEQLKSARETMLPHRANPALEDDHLATLEGVISQCDFLESRWHDLERLCEGFATTLVHGDFVRKNVAVRTEISGIVLLPFDWEHSGWAVPAADLAHVDLATYWSTVRAHWPNLEKSTLERLANAGKIFQLLNAFEWESYKIVAQRPNLAMQNYALYRTRMARAIEESALGA